MAFQITNLLKDEKPGQTVISLLLFKNEINLTIQQDITDVGADTSYVRIYISNLIKTL